MNIFVIHSGGDIDMVNESIAGLKRKTFQLNALVLKNGNAFWKLEAAAKIKKSQMVVFFIGENSHKSPYIGWEIRTAIKHNKPIYTILLGEGNKSHPALELYDSFSGQKRNYDMRMTFDELSEMINNYVSGDYKMFNEDPEKSDKKILLEQYKIFLNTSEDLVARRQNVNNFYISINSALVTLFSVLFTLNMEEKYRLLAALLFVVVGIVLSVSWIKTLVAYGNLNSSKMKIISSMEKNLPVSLYDAEWAALSDRLNKKSIFPLLTMKRESRFFLWSYIWQLALCC